MGIDMIDPLHLGRIVFHVLLDQITPAVIVVIVWVVPLQCIFVAELRTFLRPSFHVAVDANQINIVQAVEAQSAKAISNRHQRLSKRMFAPVKARFGNRINF
tara:strand:- start:104 stop:409 length:306 start_codon:yes stop_codon:yes gene_type:complete